MLEEEAQARGASPIEAGYEAARQLGNTTLAQESARGVWLAPWLESLWQDVRYAARGLRANPGFTLPALGVLVITVGLTTGVYAAIESVLLRPWPVPEPHRLDVRNRAVGLNDVRFRPSLFDELSRAIDFRAHVGIVEDWLLDELERLRPSTLHSETNRLFHAVDRGAGPRALMELTGWNERRIQRFFLTRFGASAATIRRLRRFRRSLAVLEAEAHPSRARVAAHLGFSGVARFDRVGGVARDAGAVDAARIPVERCAGPVLLVSGGDDHVWPTARMCAMLVERMSSHGRRDAIRHLNYPRAGLVPEGFACLSLAYWATPETEQWFTEIPLERIVDCAG
jgi:hypothetical protein